MLEDQFGWSPLTVLLQVWSRRSCGSSEKAPELLQTPAEGDLFILWRVEWAWDLPIIDSRLNPGPKQMGFVEGDSEGRTRWRKDGVLSCYPFYLSTYHIHFRITWICSETWLCTLLIVSGIAQTGEVWSYYTGKILGARERRRLCWASAQHLPCVQGTARGGLLTGILKAE